MTAHPNTIATLIGGGLGTLTGYLLARYAGLHITTVQTGGLATGYAAAVLFVGRRGLKGAALAVWNGVWNGTAKPTPVTVVLPPSEPPAA